MSQNLEEFFKDEEKSQTQTQSRRNPFFFNPFNQETPQTQTRTSLSKRRPLKFIPDVDSNTILVENADLTQLKTIEELIKLYDQPTPTDTQSVRKTETVILQYSKAKIVAETVKEVYRDLLSTNDKSLENTQGRGGQRMPGFMYMLGEGDNSGQKMPKFKGLLSIGVDELSNSLVISAPAFLFEQVVQMVKELDDAAVPTSTVKVVKLGQGVSGDRTKEVLSAILGQTESGSSRQGTQYQQNYQQFQRQGQGQQGRGNRGSSQQQQQQNRQGGGGGRRQGGGNFGGGGGGPSGGPGGG